MIVDVRFVNGSGEAVTLDSSSLVLIDSGCRKNEVDTDRFEFVPESRDLFLGQVNPGVTMDGQAIFTVAPGSSGFVLEAGDTDPFGGENAYVNLGFPPLHTASLVFGVAGGVFGVLAGLFAMLVGGIGYAFEAEDSALVLGLGFVACLLGVCGIVGGVLAPRYPVVSAVVSAILQAGVGLMGFVAVSLFWVLPGVLLLVGALVAVLGHLLERG